MNIRYRHNLLKEKERRSLSDLTLGFSDAVLLANVGFFTAFLLH